MRTAWGLYSGANFIQMDSYLVEYFVESKLPFAHYGHTLGIKAVLRNVTLAVSTLFLSTVFFPATLVIRWRLPSMFIQADYLTQRPLATQLGNCVVK